MEGLRRLRATSRASFGKIAAAALGSAPCAECGNGQPNEEINKQIKISMYVCMSVSLYV